jgi:hypothetical protein
MDEQELERVREVVLLAHPDAVPELVRGGTVEELLGSVEGAKAAYARIAEVVKPAASVPAESVPAVAAPPPAVPAGAGTAVVDPANLPAHELIRRGLAAKPSRA